MKVKNRNISLFLKRELSNSPENTKNYRDVILIGYYGTADIEPTVS